MLIILPTGYAASELKDIYGPKVVYGGLLFRYYFPKATSVYIAGDFTKWSPLIKLKKTSHKGAFQAFVPLLLKKKKYRYKLIIDQIWQKDPYNTSVEYDHSGGELSCFEVPNTMMTYGVNPQKKGTNLYRFYYKNTSASSVRLVGSFNNYNTFEHTMKKDANGIWVITVQVFPGKHYYCFIVDGNWVVDTARIPTAFNRFGREFSVFTAH